MGGPPKPTPRSQLARGSFHSPLAFRGTPFGRPSQCAGPDLNLTHSTRVARFVPCFKSAPALRSRRSQLARGSFHSPLAFRGTPFGRPSQCAGPDLNRRTPTRQRPKRCAVSWLGYPRAVAHTPKPQKNLTNRRRLHTERTTTVRLTDWIRTVGVPRRTVRPPVPDQQHVKRVDQLVRDGLVEHVVCPLV